MRCLCWFTSNKLPSIRLTIMVLNTEWAQVEVIDLINDGSGLAFGIIGGRSTGVVVKTILPGGVADRDGRLQSGDHILQIGEVNLRGLGSEQVASVLRQCGVHVRLVVARPVESTSSDYQTLGSSAPIVPTKILGDPVELDKHLVETGYVGEVPVVARRPSEMFPPGSFIYSARPSNDSSSTIMQMHSITGLVDVVRDPVPIGQVPPQKPQQTAPNVTLLPLDMALREPNLPETEIHTVELCKDDLGLGITVAGYVCEKEEISGIFVKSISKGSAADVAKQIRVNDRIVEVDGKSVVGHTNHQAVELLRNTGSTVTIKVERYLRGPKYEQLQQAIRANELLRSSSPPSPSLSSLPKIPFSMVQMSHLAIEPELESRTSIDFDSAVLLNDNSDTPVNEEDREIVILDKSSVQFSIESHDSIYERWRGVFGEEVDIVIAQMEKEPSTGLGISLEGTVDVEDGKEVRPHHYIRNILPHGPVGRNGVLKSGDELLEVNGIRLEGLNHLEVVAILKQLPDFVILTCARRSQDSRIIDTAQHRDAFKARNILAGSLQSIVPAQPQDKLVKAKSETSLASSGAGSDLCSVGTLGSRSRSLELIEGIPMWSTESTEVELTKGDHGLGFSILDYQDPLNTKETVIVIRSLIPGGVAQTDGRLIPGDRLLAVNGINVEHVSLDRAVQVLKGVPKGKVCITVAKPLSTNEPHSSHHSSQQHLLKIIQEWNRELSSLHWDTDDQLTCLDDFQECIEEYQECLEVVRLCLGGDSEASDAISSCCALDNDLLLNQSCRKTSGNTLCSESEADSYKSLNDSPKHLHKTPVQNVLASLLNTSSSKKEDTSDEREGYDTCAEENSLSEDVAFTKILKNNVNVNKNVSKNGARSHQKDGCNSEQKSFKTKSTENVAYIDSNTNEDLYARVSKNKDSTNKQDDKTPTQECINLNDAIRQEISNKQQKQEITKYLETEMEDVNLSNSNNSISKKEKQENINSSNDDLIYNKNTNKLNSNSKIDDEKEKKIGSYENKNDCNKNKAAVLKKEDNGNKEIINSYIMTVKTSSADSAHLIDDEEAKKMMNDEPLKKDLKESFVNKDKDNEEVKVRNDDERRDVKVRKDDEEKSESSVGHRYYEKYESSSTSLTHSFGITQRIDESESESKEENANYNKQNANVNAAHKSNLLLGKEDQNLLNNQMLKEEACFVEVASIKKEAKSSDICKKEADLITGKVSGKNEDLKHVKEAAVLTKNEGEIEKDAAVCLKKNQQEIEKQAVALRKYQGGIEKEFAAGLRKNQGEIEKQADVCLKKNQQEIEKQATGLRKNQGEIEKEFAAGLRKNQGEIEKEAAACLKKNQQEFEKPAVGLRKNQGEIEKEFAAGLRKNQGEIEKEAAVCLKKNQQEFEKPAVGLRKNQGEIEKEFAAGLRKSQGTIEKEAAAALRKYQGEIEKEADACLKKNQQEFEKHVVGLRKNEREIEKEFAAGLRKNQGEIEKEIAAAALKKNLGEIENQASSLRQNQGASSAALRKNLGEIEKQAAGFRKKQDEIENKMDEEAKDLNKKILVKSEYKANESKKLDSTSLIKNKNEEDTNAKALPSVEELEKKEAILIKALMNEEWSDEASLKRDKDLLSCVPDLLEDTHKKFGNSKEEASKKECSHKRTKSKELKHTELDSLTSKESSHERTKSKDLKHTEIEALTFKQESGHKKTSSKEMKYIDLIDSHSADKKRDLKHTEIEDLTSTLSAHKRSKSKELKQTEIEALTFKQECVHKRTSSKDMKYMDLLKDTHLPKEDKEKMESLHKRDLKHTEVEDLTSTLSAHKRSKSKELKQAEIDALTLQECVHKRTSSKDMKYMDLLKDTHGKYDVDKKELPKEDKDLKHIEIEALTSTESGHKRSKSKDLKYTEIEALTLQEAAHKRTSSKDMKYMDLVEDMNRKYGGEKMPNKESSHKRSKSRELKHQTEKEALTSTESAHKRTKSKDLKYSEIEALTSQDAHKRTSSKDLKYIDLEEDLCISSRFDDKKELMESSHKRSKSKDLTKHTTELNSLAATHKRTSSKDINLVEDTQVQTKEFESLTRSKDKELMESSHKRSKSKDLTKHTTEFDSLTLKEGAPHKITTGKDVKHNVVDSAACKIKQSPNKQRKHDTRNIIDDLIFLSDIKPFLSSKESESNKAKPKSLSTKKKTTTIHKNTEVYYDDISLTMEETANLKKQKIISNTKTHTQGQEKGNLQQQQKDNKDSKLRTNQKQHDCKLKQSKSFDNDKAIDAIENQNKAIDNKNKSLKLMSSSEGEFECECECESEEKYFSSIDDTSLDISQLPPPLLDSFELAGGFVDEEHHVNWNDIPTTLSEPCLLDTLDSSIPTNRINLDSRPCELTDEDMQMVVQCKKCALHQVNSSHSDEKCSLDGDEFFLLQCPSSMHEEEAKEVVTRCNSEPNVLQDIKEDDEIQSPKGPCHIASLSFSGGTRNRFQRRHLVEYYNDFEECLSMLQSMANEQKSQQQQQENSSRKEINANQNKDNVGWNKQQAKDAVITTQPVSSRESKSSVISEKRRSNVQTVVGNSTLPRRQFDDKNVDVNLKIKTANKASKSPKVEAQENVKDREKKKKKRRSRELTDEEIFAKIKIRVRSSSVPANFWFYELEDEEDRFELEKLQVQNCGVCNDESCGASLESRSNSKRRKSAFVPGYCCYLQLAEFYHQQLLNYNYRREDHSDRQSPPVQVRVSVPVSSSTTSSSSSKADRRSKEGRRRSSVQPQHAEDAKKQQMTVTRSQPARSPDAKERNNANEVQEMLQKHWGITRTVEVRRGDGDNSKGIGISIVGGKVDLCNSDSKSQQQETVLGIFVKSVVPGGPADKTGKLKTGDRILEVGGIDLRNASHEKAVEAIRNASDPVRFLVQSLVPWSIETDDVERNGEECPSPYPSPVDAEPPTRFESPKPQDTSSPIKVKTTEKNDVSSVASGETNEVKEKVGEVKDESKSTVADGDVANSQNDATEEKKSDTAASKPSVVSSEDEESDEEDVRELEGRTVTAKGMEIDRASAGNVKRTKEEIAADPEQEDDFGYTDNKAKKKYAGLGHSVLLVQLERGAGSQGLGLSLAGHRDRNCMAVFVCGVNPTGAAFRAGSIQVGDEILEVNGVVLHGRCHLNASAIIKGLSGPIFKLIILRRKTAINDIAVRPITQFPVSLAEEASEESFSQYPNVRSITIKKLPGQSLGIMIIEGKHAEVGQGIFISDIQEGSSAEQAGLEIGEMILAVNKDSLLGSNYDSAANLLKRTEGLVKLVVSNPGKRPTTPAPADGKKDGGTTKGLKPQSGPPSRPVTPVPEPPADPTTCALVPGKETTIDIITDNKALGLFFVGGKDTQIPDGVAVVEIYKEGAAEKDGRLQPGDQLVECNGVSFKDATFMTVLQTLRQLLPKMKLIVFRPEKIDFQVVEVEFAKKPGKGIGISVMARKNGKGVYISEILNGGTADADGRISKGDMIIAINGTNVESSSSEEVGAVLKTVVGKVQLKLHRYKIHPR